MRSFETAASPAQSRKPAIQRTSLSPDLCEFLDMLSAIESRSAATQTRN